MPILTNSAESALSGFHVLGIDYFFGAPLDYEKVNKDPSFDKAGWMKKAREVAAEAVERWVDGVRKMYGEDAKYSAVGYCFGAPYLMNLVAQDDKIVAGAFAHPSVLEEEKFRKVKKPLFLLCAETDRAFDKDARRKAEDILEEIKAKYTFQIFSGVDHGFAVRGDPNDPDQRWAKEESSRGIIEWFTRFSDA